MSKISSQVVYDHQGIALRAVLRDFWLQLRAKSPQQLQRSITIFCYCDHGKHRSVAVASIILYCLHHDDFKIQGVNRWPTAFAQLMNRPHWRRDACSGKLEHRLQCRHCYSSLVDRTGPHWMRALQLWHETRKQILSFWGCSRALQPSLLFGCSRNIWRLQPSAGQLLQLAANWLKPRCRGFKNLRTHCVPL